MDTIAYITSKAEQYDLKDIVARKTKLDKSELPKSLSSFENDVGFITDAVANLKNYYTKENTYTKEEVQQLVAQKIRIQVVESLPTENISNSTIYFLCREKTHGTTQYQEDIYDEYIYVDGVWELIGNTYVDLTNYYTKEETDDEIKNRIKTEIDNVKQTINENENDIENKLSETNTKLQNETDRSKLKDSEIEQKIKDNAKSIEDEKKRAEEKELELQNKDTVFQSHVENAENPHGTTKEQIGLGNVTNVSTTEIIANNSKENITSGAVFDALDAKVDKVTGKGLSDQNYTFDEKTKLSNLKNYDDTELRKEVDNNTESITILNADASTENSVSNKIKTALENINSISFSIVSELPETGQAGVIYFVSDSTTIDETSSYSEYVWLDSKFELLGQKTMNVDLSEFYKKTEVNALVSAKNDKITIKSESAALTDTDTFDETAAGTNPAETKSRTLPSLWEYLRNKVYPIGVVYVQYPQQKGPNELFPGTTWSEIGYSGAFFRASGGNASAFIEKTGNLSKQVQSIQSHSHTFTPSGSISGGAYKFTGSETSTSTAGSHYHSMGVIMDETPHAEAHGSGYYGRWSTRTTGTAGSHSHKITGAGTISISQNPTFTGINGSTSDTGSAETRPGNYTIRIWKRTA